MMAVARNIGTWFCVTIHATPSAAPRKSSTTQSRFITTAQ
jgi:hypothetical protein